MLPYVLKLANGEIFKGVHFLKLDPLLHKLALFRLKLLLTVSKAVTLRLELHLALVPLGLKTCQIFLSVGDFFPELQGLVSASLVFKLCLI